MKPRCLELTYDEASVRIDLQRIRVGNQTRKLFETVNLALLGRLSVLVSLLGRLLKGHLLFNGLNNRGIRLPEQIFHQSDPLGAVNELGSEERQIHHI